MMKYLLAGAWPALVLAGCVLGPDAVPLQDLTTTIGPAGTICEDTRECSDFGTCTRLEDGSCTAVGGDCLDSVICRSQGLCFADGGRCTAATDHDCAASQVCLEAGLCFEYAGICVGSDAGR